MLAICGKNASFAYSLSKDDCVRSEFYRDRHHEVRYVTIYNSYEFYRPASAKYRQTSA